MWKLSVNGVEQAPVARTPPIDALLYVANYQILRFLMTHALLQQDLEVLPLDSAGVLELVNHDVLQLGANLLKDKR